MRKHNLWILGLLLTFALGSAALAAPPPADERDGAQLKKERVSGMVESVQGQRATIRTGDGHNVQVNLGPRSFWREHGYHLIPGRQVTVEGWRRDDGDRGPLFAGGIWGPEFYFELTNSHGFPLWADQDDYWDGWYPTFDYYHTYYGPGPFVFGPPPPHWYGPRPPRAWWHRHHFYGRPGFRWGWHEYNRPFGGGRMDDRHGGGWLHQERHDGGGWHERGQRQDDRHDRGGQNDHHDNNDQRGGERGH